MPSSIAERVSSDLPGFADIETAAARLAGKAVVTPLLEYPELNERLGGRVLLKPEILQRTGSFKFRGAYNRIAQIPAEQRGRGVLAYSSGNHAQGVAAAAKLLGLPATIVMPADAPAIKVSNTKAYGATVVFYDRYSEDREAIAEALIAKTGATLVRPYDDPAIIAGQGTCGLELMRQARALDALPDTVLVCCGGGGLTAGTALAVKTLSPAAEVYAVEPEDFDDTARSLASGSRQANRPEARSICDALLSPTPGELTFQLNRRLLAGAVGVSDAEVERAMAFAFNRLKLVVEPGGAVSLAAALAGKIETAGRTTALVLSGGNVDGATMQAALDRNPC
ncbi:L-threonine ammonia-lyase [Tistlia consotensis]|uniref:L-threonine ammonia-lyase n=1 Tax=Tistlia consotensis USBA 355 TaxID=560819 RepID=A0A1Y6BSD9_9PROT|nr:threonine/serine dehydratase [Tistlia consotensis]SMF18499.1 L-threonine ammonia-lyase [Tistlia consotensis USBA 355]SNR39667.1 L-threonine ammonia-lyase [Tistlia consotensis]